MIARHGGQSQPIRILLTVPHLESTASPYREMMAVARYLPRPEFDLTVCSLREDGFETTAPLLKELGAKVFVARFRPRGKQWGHWRSCLKDQKHISARGPFDVQHSFDFSSVPIEAILARLWGRPFVFTQRNLNVDGHSALLRAKGILACRVVAISGAVHALLASMGFSSRKLTDISLGIDEGIEPGGALEDLPVSGRFVLSVGQIIPLKRQADGIEAFALIAEALPDLSLLIAGRAVDQGYAESLKTLVQQRALTGRVHFLGSRKDVGNLMRRAACLLHCSESEAFGWTILEAMMAGLPVVASSVGGIKEVIQDGRTGMLVEAGDVGGFAAAMRRVFNEPETAHGLVVEASKAVRERYSAPEMVSRLAGLYREVEAECRSRA